ncbi:MAG: BON domain-containing protein [Legionellaceae bacterium]|nr:BON domain-containing protein [Legionellaceae bacterium]
MRNEMRRMTWVLLSTILLSGCVAVAVIGAAAGMIVYDKRSLRVMEKDARIFHLIHKRIANDPDFSGSRIDVISFNQVVLLVGQTPSASLRMKAEKIAQSTAQVRRVYDQISIGYPISLSQKGQDSWISSEVKSRLVARKNLESGSIKVVTENTVVYLMGIVTKEQAALAVDTARRVKGVAKVVKVFQYIV